MTTFGNKITTTGDDFRLDTISNQFDMQIDYPDNEMLISKDSRIYNCVLELICGFRELICG